MIAKSLPFLSAKAKSSQTASCKGTLPESQSTGVGSISGVNTRAVSTIPGCRAGPRLSPVPPGSQGQGQFPHDLHHKTEPLCCCCGWDSHQGLKHKADSQVWSAVLAPCLPTLTLQEPGAASGTSQTLVSLSPPEKLAWYTWSYWGNISQCLRKGCHPPLHPQGQVFSLLLGFQSWWLSQNPEMRARKRLGEMSQSDERSWRHQRRVRLMVCWRERGTLLGSLQAHSSLKEP